MISAFIAVAFAIAPFQILMAADSGRGSSADWAVQDSGSTRPIADAGPRLRRVAFGVDDSASHDLSARPRAVEHSDAYYTRLTIHRVASYTEFPLFAAEYVLGERLLKDERTGYPPSSLKNAHVAVAGGLGVLFTVNTITGVWNAWDARHDSAGRTLRLVHSAAMLGADAGFAWAGAIGGNARNSTQAADRHRVVSIGSMALATAGTAIMWFFHN